MGLELDVQRVSQVLLADGWHQVAERSFMLDSYDFIHHGNAREPNEFDFVHRAGDAHVCATGFSFFEERVDREHGATEQLAGPLTAILAIRYHAVSGR